MKKSLIATTVLMTFASASAFAHHPAADIVDPEIYAMIDANVADTPHADLVLDDMGSAAMDDVGTVADSDSPDSTAPRYAGREDMDFAISIDESVDTIGLLGDVASALAE